MQDSKVFGVAAPAASCSHCLLRLNGAHYHLDLVLAPGSSLVHMLQDGALWVEFLVAKESGPVGWCGYKKKHQSEFWTVERLLS